ncbi:DUF6894 family protein [Methylobacterium oryzae]|uniref:DUF6894 domain-containing protein n=1 Tax=Methylobacterium oryzae TaxID=334852 RepID=A0ABU7TSP5_9HYPH
MPRYHFHIHDGSTILNAAGVELPDWHSARPEAVRRAGDIPKQDAQRIALGTDRRLEHTDATGLILFQMAFPVVESPVMRRQSATER